MFSPSLHRMRHTTTGSYSARSPDELRNELKRVLGAAREDLEIDEVTLKSAVCAYVGQLRDTGATPERVLVDVKAIASGSGIPASRTEEKPANQRERLMQSIVTWCITEYYRGASRASAPPAESL